MRRCTARWTRSSTPTACWPGPRPARPRCGEPTGAGSPWPGRPTATRPSAWPLGQPGQEVIITRTLHRSLLLGMVLAGLRPVWVRPEIEPGSGLPGAVAVQTVRDALAAHPGACGVILGEPVLHRDHRGPSGSRTGRASAAGVPLIVDAAWAAYLGFHPDLPPHAIAAGADAMVTSAHKALPAYTQGALVLARTERLDAARLDRAFEATHTTSPTGSIMASIDAARALLAADGERLCGRLIRGVAAARKRLREIPGVDVLDGPEVSRRSWSCCWRPPAPTATRWRRTPRRRDAGGDGRPRHCDSDPDDRRRRGPGRRLHRSPHRGYRAASRARRALSRPPRPGPSSP